MRTPVGLECKYFFGDYFRGRSIEECRLLHASGQAWKSDLCKSCPVPGIVRANACDFLQLTAKVTRPFSAAFMQRVEISAFCDKSQKAVKEPQIGCGDCHPLPPIFEVTK